MTLQILVEIHVNSEGLACIRVISAKKLHCTCKGFLIEMVWFDKRKRQMCHNLLFVKIDEIVIKTLN